ncbi:MAG: arylsulfatase [Planctomycetota bacterium]
MEGQTGRPNIVFIFPDQWRWDCLGSLGHPVVATPFLDELAAGGVTFTNAYTPVPTCIAARASVMTGMDPWNHGRLGYRDCVPWTYDITLPGQLRNSGYQTMVAGKTHFYPQRAGLGFEQLRLYETQIHGDEASDYHLWLHRETGGAYTDLSRDIDPNGMLCRPWTYPDYQHPNTWTMSAALDMLKLRDPLRPFFMQISFQRPHTPIDPPIDYYQRYRDCPLPAVPVGDWAEELSGREACVSAVRGRLDPRQLDEARRGYYAQLSHIDYQIGRLLRYLSRSGMMGNTWILFASDHGEMLGDHHHYRKSTPFEGAAAIPFVVRPPSSARPGGRVCDKPITLGDVMPFCLDVADVPIPPAVDGRSFRSLLDDPQRPWRSFVHVEHAPAWQAVTDGKQKFAWHSQSGQEYFFDLETDPFEQRNLAASHPDAALWRRRLVEVLEPRADGMVDGGRLVAGTTTPPIRA